MKLSLSQPNYRDAFASRARHDRLRQTHVVVGDHEPEPRVRHEAAPDITIMSFDENGDMHELV